MSNVRTDWDSLFSNVGEKTAVQFATGCLSGENFRLQASNRGVGGIARTLLRQHGTTYSRRICRKALRRRGLEV